MVPELVTVTRDIVENNASIVGGVLFLFSLFGGLVEVTQIGEIFEGHRRPKNHFQAFVTGRKFIDN